MVHAEINPSNFYDQDAVKRLLGLSNRAIISACRSGKLKVSVQAGTRFFRGQWLIDWLEGNQLPQQPPRELQKTC